MPSPIVCQERLAAGLCSRCAQPRIGKGSTTRYCPPCAEAIRVADRARYALRKQTQTPVEAAARAARQRGKDSRRYNAVKAAGCCPICCQKLTGADRLQANTICTFCRVRKRAADAEARRRNRLAHSPWANHNDGKPLPLGSSLRVGAVRTYGVTLDSGAFRALRELKARDREARLKKSRSGKIEVVYQVSRIVREALRSWANIPVCPTRLASYRKMIECPLSFYADAQTVAAIERHKGARGGNLSATICDLLVATAARPNYTPQRTALRLSAGGGIPDPWDDD